MQVSDRTAIAAPHEYLHGRSLRLGTTPSLHRPALPLIALARHRVAYPPQLRPALASDHHGGWWRLQVSDRTAIAAPHEYLHGRSSRLGTTPSLHRPTLPLIAIARHRIAYPPHLRPALASHRWVHWGTRRKAVDRSSLFCGGYGSRGLRLSISTGERHPSAPSPAPPRPHIISHSTPGDRIRPLPARPIRH